MEKGRLQASGTALKLMVEKMHSGRLGDATAEDVAQMYKDKSTELHVAAEKLIDKSDEMTELKRAIWEAAHPDEPFVLGGDDDLAVVAAGTEENFICPITRMELVEPMRNVCGHVYSKVAVLDYLRRHRHHADCPVAGCPQQVSQNTLKPDTNMQRKLANHKKRKRSEQDDNIEDL